MGKVGAGGTAREPVQTANGGWRRERNPWSVPEYPILKHRMEDSGVSGNRGLKISEKHDRPVGDHHTDQRVLPLMACLLSVSFFAASSSFANGESSLFSYELSLVNNSGKNLTIKKSCANGKNCFSGELRSKQTIWLTHTSSVSLPEIDVSLEIEGLNPISSTCTIHRPISRCAYELSISAKKLICPKQSDDCLKF